MVESQNKSRGHTFVPSRLAPDLLYWDTLAGPGGNNEWPVQSDEAKAIDFRLCVPRGG